MTLMSMTGFARSEGVHGPLRWFWELRSVNGRGLDVRLRVPPGFEGLDTYVREGLGARLTRGSVQVALQVQRVSAVPEVRVNMAVLEKILDAVSGLRAHVEAERPRLDGLLALKGVIDLVEPEETEEDAQARIAALKVSFDEAATALVAARADEGARMAGVLTGHVETIERLTAKAKAAPARQPEAVRERLAVQVRRLLEASDQFDPDRLHQEAVMLAAKADFQEELDRLEAHVAAARTLLAADGAVGRKLDFLTQEFNRETNTLCAKANDVTLSAIGLEMKAVVDQLREQVQNVE